MMLPLNNLPQLPTIHSSETLMLNILQYAACVGVVTLII